MPVRAAFSGAGTKGGQNYFRRAARFAYIARNGFCANVATAGFCRPRKATGVCKSTVKTNFCRHKKKCLTFYRKAGIIPTCLMYALRTLKA